MKKSIVYVVLALVAIVTAYKFITLRSASDDTLRHLSSGDVVGFEDRTNTHAWLGIPFAKPPVGDLRWRAPQPVAPWQGVRESLHSGSMCTQVLPFAWPKDLIKMGDEDCLNLDVWSPRLSADEVKSSKLPVMVWIHGGANTLGMSSAARYYNLAGSQDVIVVALQYRLGLFGWLSHPAARDSAPTEADTTSNFALLDMIAALQWVQDNAAAFGGDPDNVTIFGQSAGAFDVFALLASPRAEGLFHRAIAQSGNVQTVPQAQAENYRDDAEPGLPYSSREFINKLLIADGTVADRTAAKALQDSMASDELMAYLRGKSPEELLTGVEKRGGLGYFTPTNIRDGYALPHKPLLEVFSDPTQYNQVPLLLGSNRDEYKFFLWNEDRFGEKRFGFLPDVDDVDEYNRVTGYFSDQWQVIGVNEPAAVLSQSQPGQVYGYRFDWAGQKTMAGVNMSDLFGAAHGIEVTFVFGPEAVDTLSLFAMAEDDQGRADLGNAMMDYWATFAKTGEPGNGGNPKLPVWRAWDSEHKKLILDREEAGGIRMNNETLSADELKQRLQLDAAIQTDRERCELYAQLFHYALTTDFWSDEEYTTLGCDAYPVEEFDGII